MSCLLVFPADPVTEVDLVRTLKTAGHQVRIGPDPELSRAVLGPSTAIPDLIICELGSTRPESLRSGCIFREQGSPLERVPLILVSWLGDMPEQKQLARYLRASSVVTAPWRADELLQAVEQALTAPVPGIPQGREFILVVEDNGEHREILRRMICSLGHEAVTVASGLAALEVVQVNDPAVVVIDLKLPDIDGLSLAHSLELRVPDVSVVLMTSFGGESVARRAFLNGVDDYLAKPIHPKELGATLRRVLARRVLRACEIRLRRNHRELEETVTDLFEGCGEGVLVVDPANREVLEAHGEAARLLGVSDTGLPALPPHLPMEPFPPRELELERSATGRSFIEVSAHFVRWKGCRRLMVRVRDIRDRVSLREKERNEARLLAELTQASKLAGLGTILSEVVHELNNPLCSISGFAGLMLEGGEATAALREDLVRVQNNADRCVKIVKNILGFARQSTGELTLASIQVPIERAISLVACQIRNTAVQVVRQLDDDLPTVLIDEQKVVQVVLNLISNAIHALRGSPAPRMLRVRARRADGGCAVNVENNGPPLTADVLARMFDPFFTTKPSGEGTGLGLPLCQEIMKGLSGSIAGENREGWVSFTLRFPVPNCIPRVVPAQEQVPFNPNRMDGVRALVIDDEADCRELVTRCLSALGAHLEAAADGPAALAYLSEQSYDLIVCDIRMPGMSGLELFRYLQTCHPAMAHNVLFTSGDTSCCETQRQLSLTGSPVLSKPFDHRALVDAAKAVLTRAARGGRSPEPGPAGPRGSGADAPADTSAEINPPGHGGAAS